MLDERGGFLVEAAGPCNLKCTRETNTSLPPSLTDCCYHAYCSSAPTVAVSTAAHVPTADLPTISDVPIAIATAPVPTAASTVLTAAGGVLLLLDSNKRTTHT